MKKHLSPLLATASLMLFTNASAQNPSDKSSMCDTTDLKYKISKTVCHQFNAVRNNIHLPAEVEGKIIKWNFTSSEKDMNEYVTLIGNEMLVKKLPKKNSIHAGSITAETDGGTYTYDVTLAKDDNMYGYLYCHMAMDKEETLYAIGKKEDEGAVFHNLLNNQPVYRAQDVAKIEGGVRDAFIYRAPDNNGYVMVTTDMSNHKSRTWFNHGIDLLKSNDLVHWTSVSFDFRKGSEIFSDPQSPDVLKDYTKINRVWAPQVIWDKEYNNGQGGYFIYYSMLSTNEGDKYDKIYYSYSDKSFTQLTKPKLLYDAGRAVIDCDITWNDCDSVYNVLFKREGASGFERGIYKATFDKLGDQDWNVRLHITNEGKENVEGPSAFRKINSNTWVIGYIRYSGGKSYRICTADASMENVSKSVEIRDANLKPQHGSFMTLTEDEYNMLEAWSELTLKVQELEKSTLSETDREKTAKAKEALQKQYKKNPVKKLLKLYRKHIKALENN